MYPVFEKYLFIQEINQAIFVKKFLKGGAFLYLFRKRKFIYLCLGPVKTSKDALKPVLRRSIDSFSNVVWDVNPVFDTREVLRFAKFNPTLGICRFVRSLAL